MHQGNVSNPLMGAYLATRQVVWCQPWFGIRIRHICATFVLLPGEWGCDPGHGLEALSSFVRFTLGLYIVEGKASGASKLALRSNNPLKGLFINQPQNL